MIQKLAVPIAIVIAGALIAGAVYLAGSGTPVAPAPTGGVAEEIRDVQKDDHVRGNPKAEIVLVEYSDTECPFCKQYHHTMKRIIDEYGQSGKVAWVYRHFPLEQLHAKAKKEAEALECAAELGGNDAFWKYTDRVYEITPSNDGLDSLKLPEIAVEIGLDKSAFEACLASGKHLPRIEKDTQEVAAAGGRGTPHTIVIVDGEQVPIEGAQPYEVVKGLIDRLLAE